MRTAFTIVFGVLVVALGVCAAVARRSHRSIGRPVALLLAALIPPVIGNSIIIATASRPVATFGCYIYFLGMDFVMYALLRFTFEYCYISWPGKGLKWFVYAMLLADAAQLLLNPIFGHAFSTEALVVGGHNYYCLIPYLGQSFHRLVCYGIFAAVLIIFLYKLARSPRIYSERYSVILLTMVFAGIWQSFYIFSRTPIDRSMIGFGVFGLLVFYFALYYRPMRLLDRMLASIASEMPEALFFFDPNGRCIWANRPGKQLTGLHGRDFDAVPERLREMFGSIDVERDRRVVGEGSNRRYLTLEKRTVTDAKYRAVGSFLSVRDNTEDQSALRKERYTATHDALTGVYTRERLYERSRELMNEYPDAHYLVVFVDVKDFKLVNDIFGNDFGDFALCRIADWTHAGLSDRCAYGRLGGDTFGICLPADEFDAEAIEHQLLNFIVEDGSIEHQVLIHLGVYEVTEPDLDVSVMFDRARMALSTIKDEYQKHIAYYDERMRSRVLWNQHISTQLREALADGQIRPYLQPIVNEAGRVVGAEALVRWIHPVDGFLSPAAFIPVFEENGMIADVDKFMWRSACEILKRWESVRPDLFISINISPKDFYCMDVSAEIQSVVAEYGIDPARLRVEITETVMMTDIENRIKLLNDLKAAGFYIEMDDFGSGYSSLNMLKDMPVDLIKLDMMFLTKTHDMGKAQTILRNVIRLSDDLGIAALTEGVETETQYRALTDMGCRLFQGYHFARPMPVEEFEKGFFTAA